MNYSYTSIHSSQFEQQHDILTAVSPLFSTHQGRLLYSFSISRLNGGAKGNSYHNQKNACCTHCWWYFCSFAISCLESGAKGGKSWHNPENANCICHLRVWDNGCSRISAFQHLPLVCLVYYVSFCRLIVEPLYIANIASSLNINL